MGQDGSSAAHGLPGTAPPLVGGEAPQTDAALLALEEHFRIVADFTCDWEVWTGPDGVLRYVSPSSVPITGYSPEEFFADPGLLLRIVHPEDRPLIGAHGPGGDGRSAGRLDFRIITRGGEERWIGHVGQPVYAADGTWLGYRGSNRDITASRRAGLERERLVARQRRLLAHSQAVLAQQTVEGLTQVIVHAARDLTDARIGISGHGYRGGTFRIGATSWAEETPPCPEGQEFGVERGGVYLDLIRESTTLRLTDEELRTHPAWWGVPEDHSPLRGLLGARLVGRDGEANGLIMVSDKQGGADFTVADEAILDQLAAMASLALQHLEARLSLENEASALFSAYAELEIAGEELRQQNDELLAARAEMQEAQGRVEELAARDQAILASMGDGLVIFDPEGNILEMNPAALKLHGFESADDVPRHVRGFEPRFELHHLDGSPLAIAGWPLARVLNGESLAGFEVRVRKLVTGSDSVWSYDAAPIRNREGNVILGIVTIRDVTWQKDVERALRRQFSFLEQLVAEAPVGIAVVGGPDHRYELVNACYRAISGVSDVSMEGHTIAEVFPQVAAHGALTFVEEACRTGQTVSLREFEVAGGPGREGTYWNVDHVPLFDAAGEVERVLILAQDISDQVRARRGLERVTASLAEERARLDTIIHNAPEGIVMVDAQARILLTNPAADRLYAWPVPYGQGYESHGELALCYPDGTPYDPRDLPLTRSALDGETWQELEMAIVWPDGQSRDLLINTSPIRAQEGEILGAVAVFQDITERNQTREALRRARDELEERVLERTSELAERTLELEAANEGLQVAQERLRRQYEELREMQIQVENERQRYQELFDFAPDGYLLTDHGGTIQEANRAAAGMLGVDAGELRGRNLRAFVSRADTPTFSAYLQRLSAGQGDLPPRWEARLVPAGGGAIHAALAATVAHSASGAVKGIRWLLRDVTRDRQMHAALVHSEKLSMAGQLAASLAHEINNPLAAAVGCVDLVREALQDGDDPTQMLDVLREALGRTARIVSQLRQLHRRAEVEEKQLRDLNELVDAVLLLAGKKARSAGVEISWQRVEGLPLLPLMTDGIQQVFLNLVLNAVDAMQGGGHLSVCILPATRPAWIGVEFKDDGPGIPAKIRERLFEPFKTTKATGSGLGLFISHNIVQQHGGSIEVETAPRKGTTITVWLPADESRIGPASS